MWSKVIQSAVLPPAPLPLTRGEAEDPAGAGGEATDAELLQGPDGRRGRGAEGCTPGAERAPGRAAPPQPRGGGTQVHTHAQGGFYTSIC